MDKGLPIDDFIVVKDGRILMGNEILAEGKEANTWAVKAGYQSLEHMMKTLTIENKDQVERLER